MRLLACVCMASRAVVTIVAQAPDFTPYSNSDRADLIEIITNMML